MLLVFILIAHALRAQVTVNVSIDSVAIFIGQQCHINLKVTAPQQEQVTFPVFPKKVLTDGIEVLKEEIVATEKINDGRQTSTTKQYTITSFDSSMYYIPPFKVKVGAKEYQSKSLALKVETLDVDTLHLDQFFGPKPQAEVPFSWNDFRPMFYLSLLLLLLLFFAGYIAVQLHNNRPLIRRIRIRPVLPPHLWAIKEIEKLKVDTVKKEDAKEYYSELTDVLRSYIHRRYGFNAMEMTSGEIIESLMRSQDQQALDELRELFYTADLAKFAKLQTRLNENDENLLRAVNFIQATKVEETEAAVRKKVEVPKEVKRTDRNRLILKLSVAVLLLLSVGLLFEIGRELYNLFY